MLLTPFIKQSMTMPTFTHGYIRLYCHLSMAFSTQYRLCPIFLFPPRLYGMMFKSIVTFITGIILITTFKFYCDNIITSKIMSTTCFLIFYMPIYVHGSNLQTFYTISSYHILKGQGNKKRRDAIHSLVSHHINGIIQLLSTFPLTYLFVY